MFLPYYNRAVGKVHIIHVCGTVGFMQYKKEGASPLPANFLLSHPCLSQNTASRSVPE